MRIRQFLRQHSVSESIVNYSYSILSKEGKEGLEDEFRLDSDSEVRRRCPSPRSIKSDILLYLVIFDLFDIVSTTPKKNRMKNCEKWNKNSRKTLL